MKKLILAFTALLLSVAAFASDRIVYNDSPLPAMAKQLLSTNFKSKVNHVKIDNNALGKVSDYEVVLENGTEVEFDSKGNLKSVDAGKNGVPSSVIPSEINSYLKTNFKKQKVYEFSVERNGYKVELSNGVDLRFDLNGKYLRRD